LGIHTAEIPSDSVGPGGVIEFTWLDLASNTWLGKNHSIEVQAA
jgi:hypothetical protein